MHNLNPNRVPIPEEPPSSTVWRHKHLHTQKKKPENKTRIMYLFAHLIQLGDYKALGSRTQ